MQTLTEGLHFGADPESRRGRGCSLFRLKEQGITLVLTTDHTDGASWVSPLWHAVELGRAATIGADVSGGMIAVHVGYMLALCVGGWVLARRHYRRRLVG